ncbi:MAG: ABC transporter permease, partial [Bacteroidota bacterium]
MLKNFFLITFRNLIKHPVYSFLTIFGLAVGIAAGFFILQYVHFETTYDHFFENKENIYRVQLNRYDRGELATQWASGCAGVGLAMKEDLPEVEAFVNLTKSSAQISYEKKYFTLDHAYYAGRSFFEVFSVPLLQGVDSLVLKNPFTVVLSKSLSEKIFGNTDPVGQYLTMNDEVKFEITGIFADLPERSHMAFDLLYSFESYVKFTSENSRTEWQWDGFLNYIVLQPGTDPKVLAQKFPDFIEQRAGEELRQYNAGMEFILQPLTQIHLISNYRGEIKATGDEKATYFLLIIGLFVLVIAWINYVNLSTAHSLKRAREVGIRKVLGSFQSQLIRQFLLESTFMNLLAFLVAAAFILTLFPYFNHFLGRSTAYSWPDSSLFWVGIFGLFLGGILLSGFYPALVLSNFRPITVLKGQFS